MGILKIGDQGTVGTIKAYHPVKFSGSVNTSIRRSTKTIKRNCRHAAPSGGNFRTDWPIESVTVTRIY